MSVIRSSEAPVFELPGFSIYALSAPSRGASELCTWRLRVLPGADSGVHSLDHEEVFVVVSGTLGARIGDQEHLIHADDALVVSAGTEFSIYNPGDVQCTAVVSVPAGLIGTMAGQSQTPPWAL
ncbi:MAG TPA: cupin domain-containing protein [Gemmatimonadaceae bacterium]|nr:cupin domain-containing protein [Gemmatimonadaceae bacterium]